MTYFLDWLGMHEELAVLGSLALTATIIITITTICSTIRKVRKDEGLLELKQSMIEQGLSADEMERVLRA